MVMEANRRVKVGAYQDVLGIWYMLNQLVGNALIKVSSCLVAAGEKRGLFVGGTKDSGLTVCFNELRGGIGGGSGGMESSIAGIEVSPLNVQLPWGLLARNSSSTLS